MPPGHVRGPAASSDGVPDSPQQECDDGCQISHPSLQKSRPRHASQERESKEDS